MKWGVCPLAGSWCVYIGKLSDLSSDFTIRSQSPVNPNILLLLQCSAAQCVHTCTVHIIYIYMWYQSRGFEVGHWTTQDLRRRTEVIPFNDSHNRIQPLALAGGHCRYITVKPERTNTFVLWRVAVTYSCYKCVTVSLLKRFRHLDPEALKKNPLGVPESSRSNSFSRRRWWGVLHTFL